MKKAEQMAWGAMWGLIGIGILLLVAAIWFHVTMFWAGAMLCGGQAVVMGLAAYGLSLAQQAAELRESLAAGGTVSSVGRRVGAADAGGGFRMSMGAEDVGATEPDEGANTLDTTHQRMLVLIAGVLLIALAVTAKWMVLKIYWWSLANPNLKVPIAGTLESVTNPKLWQAFDEYALLAGLVASLAYGVLYYITRPARRTGVHGMPASSNFTLGLTGMAALGIGTVLAYFKVNWASEVATLVIGAFMLLQGLELITNAFRSYASIEEMDQDVVDLQSTPLTPMLVSSWLGGVRMLLAQSVGISGGGKKGERGVIARMMPRALVALIVLAIAASCFRVVPPGKVAVLERLGYTPVDSQGRPTKDGILGEGLHLTMPWPIDKLVFIPTVQLQTVDVGQELHAPADWKNVDFQFWMVRPASKDPMADEAKDLYITGDPGSPQVLETFVEVRWRVSDPARFYTAMSHSEYFQAAASGTEELPIYQALVQQATEYAVTKTFAIHTLEQILVDDRAEAEEHCREILQDKLDAMCLLPGEKPGEHARAIDVAYLTIKDLHPPFGFPDRYNPSAPAVGGTLQIVGNHYELVNDPQQPHNTFDRGPASAFELVVSMRELREECISSAEGVAIKLKNAAHGDAQSGIAYAHAHASRLVAQAHGDADRFVEMTKGVSAENLQLMKLRLLYDTMGGMGGAGESAQGLLTPVNKVVVDPRVSDVVIIQGSEKGGGPAVPPQ